MKTLYAVLITLVLCLPVTGQKPTKEMQIEVKYDKFKDETTISTPHLRKLGRHLFFGLTVLATHPGQSVAQPIDVVFVVGSPRSFYSSKSDMILLIDGARVTLEGESHLSLDTAAVTASLDLLKRIAEAQSVEGQIASIDFKLKPEDQQVIGKVWAYFSQH